MKKDKDLNKNADKQYNLTDLDPELTFERHVFHRDQFAHYLRWTHILKKAEIGEKIVDFGCGKANLLEVLYRNKFEQASYVGIDIRKQTITQARERYKNVSWAKFYVEDLVKPLSNEFNFEELQADKVCSFEVMEHVGKQNAETFLHNFKLCGKYNAEYYLSTPNYNPNVGAAQNHIYNGQVNEFDHNELQELILKEFDIVKKYGTFASMRDYKFKLTAWQTQMFTNLCEYYDANLVSVIMAPFFPEQSRNCLWVLKAK